MDLEKIRKVTKQVIAKMNRNSDEVINLRANTPQFSLICKELGIMVQSDMYQGLSLTNGGIGLILKKEKKHLLVQDIRDFIRSKPQFLSIDFKDLGIVAFKLSSEESKRAHEIAKTDTKVKIHETMNQTKNFKKDIQDLSEKLKK